MHETFNEWRTAFGRGDFVISDTEVKRSIAPGFYLVVGEIFPGLGF